MGKLRRRSILLGFLATSFCTVFLQGIPPVFSAPAANTPNAAIFRAAILKQQLAAAWNAVLAADQAEISALNTQTAVSMKSGNANAVVAAQQALTAVKARLQMEKTWPPFPPYFQPVVATMGLLPSIEKIAIQRNNAAVAAEGQRVAVLRRLVNESMKAGDVNAVVAGVAQLKAAQARWNQDQMALKMQASQGPPGVGFSAPPRTPYPGNFFRPRGPGPQNVFRPGPFGPLVPQSLSGGGAGQPTAGAGTSLGSIPSDEWAKLLARAAKPVPWNSIPSLSSEFARYRNEPGKIIGRRVVSSLAKGSHAGKFTLPAGAIAPLPRQERLQELALRRQITEHFRLIRREARLRKKAEYRYQLDRLKRRSPNALGWQVNQNLLFAEKDECSTVTKAAYSQQRKDLRLVAIAFRTVPNHGDLVSPASRHQPHSGAVYGIVVGIASQSASRETPQISLPSGQELRSQAYQRGLQKVFPLYQIGSFLGSVLNVNIPAEAIAPCSVYTARILYCGRSPRYTPSRKPAASDPITGYVFRMKSGTKMEATTYTTGDFYYHLNWNGIHLSVAKDLVTKIITTRK